MGKIKHSVLYFKAGTPEAARLARSGRLFLKNGGNLTKYYERCPTTTFHCYIACKLATPQVHVLKPAYYAVFALKGRTPGHDA